MATFNDYVNEYKHELALTHLSKMHKAIFKTLYDNEIIDDAISFDSVEKSLENKEYKDWLIRLAEYNNDLIVTDRELKAFVVSMNLLKGKGVTMNIEEIKKGLDVGDYGEQLLDYSGNTYICDAIMEIADSNTSIYWSDIDKFMLENTGYVEDAINEFGWSGCGGDLHRAAQMGEYLSISEDIYEHYNDAIMLCVLCYLQSIGVEDITDEQLEELEDMDTDHNLKFDELFGNVHEIMGV